MTCVLQQGDCKIAPRLHRSVRGWSSQNGGLCQVRGGSGRRPQPHRELVRRSGAQRRRVVCQEGGGEGHKDRISVSWFFNNPTLEKSDEWLSYQGVSGIM
jgi:hypothetical protein